MCGFAVPEVVFHQNDLPCFIELIELQLAGQHVGYCKLLIFVRTVQQPHRQNLILGLDDQIDANLTVVDVRDETACMQPMFSARCGREIEQGEHHAE